MEWKLFRKCSTICCFVLSSIVVVYGGDVQYGGTTSENIATYIGGMIVMMGVSLFPYFFYMLKRKPDEIKNLKLFLTQNTIVILYFMFKFF